MNSNVLVILTTNAAIQLKSHRDVAIPALGLNSNITSFDRWDKTMNFRCISVLISTKNLKKNNWVDSDKLSFLTH